LIVKRPLFNHTKESCIICKDKSSDKLNWEYDSLWFTYMCKECMENYAERFRVEFHE